MKWKKKGFTRGCHIKVIANGLLQDMRTDTEIPQILWDQAITTKAKDGLPWGWRTLSEFLAQRL